MKILHISPHMGDGAGKAISGLALLGQLVGDEHSVMLLESPKKMNHIAQCREKGIPFLSCSFADEAITTADVVVLSWWGSRSMDDFLSSFPQVPCRVALWTHKNGFYSPALSKRLVKSCDALMVTSPLTLTEPEWHSATLVYGFGDFRPENIQPKEDYSLTSGEFVVGYVGMPSYKRFPSNVVDYFLAVIALIPEVRFVMAGEYSEEFRNDLEAAGLMEYVTLLGWIDDVYRLLYSFDVFGYLLRSDISATTENSVLEAMAVGLPIVMSRDPVGEYVVGKSNGFLIDSPNEYAAALKVLYEDTTLRQTRGSAGREYVLTTYNCHDNLRRFNSVCRELMASPKKLHKFEEVNIK